MPRQPIIDCHTHAYPEAVAAAPRAWAEARGETHWADLVAPTDRKTIQGWSCPESMLEAMDVAGVDQAVLLGWYWERAETCQWHNEVMAEWLQFAPDRLLGFAAISPNAPVIDQLTAAKDMGFCGVGELHIGVQSFDAQSTAWHEIASWCVAENWPVNFHVTEAAGHEHPGSIPTPLQEFVRLAESAPELRIILAHWGGGLAFFEQNPRLKKSLRNVHYDCAASPLLYEPSIFRQMADLVGIDKLLFGSDYPLRSFPRTQKSPDMATYIQSIQENSGLSAAEQSALFAGNWERIVGTKP